MADFNSKILKILIIFTFTTTPVFANRIEVNVNDESFCNHTLSKHSTIGVCVDFESKIQYCPKLLNYLKSNNQAQGWEKLHESFCSDEIRNGKICCPLHGEGNYQEDDPSYYNNNNDNNEDENSSSRIESKYLQHKNWKIFDYIFNEYSCGKIGIGERIVGGLNAVIGEFPWMVRIGYTLSDNSTLFTCSGTIITSRYILTSAHCLNYWTQHGLQLAPIRLAENDDSINPEKSPYETNVYYEDFDIDEVIIHPDYEPTLQGSHHDLALIRLAKNIDNLKKDLYKRPICLPFVQEYNLKGDWLDESVLVAKRSTNIMYRGTIAGWGKIKNSNNKSSSILQCLKVSIQPSILCRLIYSATNFSSNQVCVGGEINKNSCWGDSGGPLMIASPINAQQFQIGIISYGSSNCGEENIPTVYTRVKNYLDWILDTVDE